MKNHKIKRKANRVQRACFNCRKRKQGCDEERPCRRCIEKGIECVEVEPKRKRGRVKHGHHGHPHESSLESENDVLSPASSEIFDGDEDSSPRETTFDDYDSENEPSSELHEIGEEDDELLPIAEEIEDKPLFDPRLAKLESSIHSVNGVNIALLLPFLWNVSSLTESKDSPRTYDGEIFQFDEGPPSSPVHSLSCSPDVYNHPGWFGGNSNKDIYGFDFPFYAPRLNHNNYNGWNLGQSPLSSSPSSFMDCEDDNEIFSSMMAVDKESSDSVINESWHTFLEKVKCDDRLRKEFHHVKETWKEIMHALRTLDWPRVQGLIHSLDPVDIRSNDNTPAMVFWSSGGRIHHANNKFCSMVNYHLNELRVVPSTDGRDRVRAHVLFHPEEMVKILSRQLEAVQHPDITSYEVKTRLISKTRQEIPVVCSISNIRDALGMPLLTIAHFTTPSGPVPKI